VNDPTATLTPFILDASVLRAIARGEPDILGFIQALDAGRRPLVIPALAITGASLEVRSEEADDLMAGIELLDMVTIAPLAGAEQAARLAAVMVIAGLDSWDAHVAAVADASRCPIITLDVAKWQSPSTALDQPLQIIEIADPGD
jgi:predicted nucleic acid-binding protein